ncbi:ATP-binding protein [Methylosinus sp. Sm6]|uniref:ATP-binding protein n=1 Tax=Methylosinus sp. Sm6 TaxID=2866948 RepID=UPI001C99C24C|nr:ATP-binding protein [Methylosinus sp. Sm6]MBY6243056.1 PAS domain S-box protein [Methylosinus sp. Sm6]
MLILRGEPDVTSEDSPEHDARDELARLFDGLHATQQRILDLTEAHADALAQASGSLLRLPVVQAHLRDQAAARRRAEAERDAILEAIPMHAALLGAEGDIRVVNAAWRAGAAETGDDRGCRVGDDYLDFWRRESSCGCAEAAEAITAIEAVLDRRRGSFSQECRIASLSSHVWLRLIVAPLTDDASGGALVLHIDITDDRLTRERRQEIGEALETLIDKSPLAILVYQNFAPIAANKALAELLGYADERGILAWTDLRVALLRHLTPDTHQRLTIHLTALALARPAPARFDFTARRLDGARLDLELRVAAIKWRDQRAFCAMIADVTQQRAADERLRHMQRLDALGQLTGGVAHDFNNLLTVIMGNAEALEAGLLANDPRRSWAELVRVTAQKAAAVTSRLLAFARRRPLDPSVIDVAEVVAGLTSFLDRVIGSHIAVCSISVGAPLYVLADVSQFENAILNLCLNARDAMPSGGSITIEAADVEIDARQPSKPIDLNPGRYVSITVSDTGNGMDRETLSRAFEPFFTTKETGSGTGLGLSMVFDFVEQSGGAVSIASEPGKGTNVRLWFPRQETPVRGQRFDEGDDRQ